MVKLIDPQYDLHGSWMHFDTNSDQLTNFAGPMIPHVWMFLTHTHLMFLPPLEQEDVDWGSCGQELLTGQRQRAASESDLIVLDQWDQWDQWDQSSAHVPKLEATRKNHGWNVGGCWGYPPWWLPAAIRMILFWSAQEIHCTMERLLSACSFSSNSLQISGVYTKGHSRVFYFKIEAHLQSQPKNVGQVATLWFTRIPNIYFITIAQPRSHWVRALHWPVRPARLHDRPLVCTNSPSASHAVLTISHGEVGRP